jgi:hypothetical protein
MGLCYIPNVNQKPAPFILTDPYGLSLTEYFGKHDREETLATSSRSELDKSNTAGTYVYQIELLRI